VLVGLLEHPIIKHSYAQNTLTTKNEVEPQKAMQSHRYCYFSLFGLELNVIFTVSNYA